MEAVARLKNNRRSPRKMRMVADLVRGKSVEEALGILKFSKRYASKDLEKLLVSAVANWQVKNAGQSPDTADLFVKTIVVDKGRTLKRFRPAPFGRPHKIRKHSNHVTLVVDSLQETQNNLED